MSRLSPAQDSTLVVDSGGNARRIGKRPGAHLVPLPEGAAPLSGVFRRESDDFFIGQDGELWASRVPGERHRTPDQDSAPPVKKFGSVNSDVMDVAFGSSHGLILKRSGEVWSWGRNDTGQLGRETPETTSKWATIPGLGGIVEIAVADSIDPNGGYSLALDADGVVWGWGDDNFGVLGRRAHAERGKPAPVSGLPEIAHISAGFYHVVAIDRSGSLWVWGMNYDGQLGAPTPLPPGMARPELTMMQYEPLRLDLGATFVSASANRKRPLTPNYVIQFSVAVDDVGRLWTWGNGWYGTLVTGSKRRDSSKPAPRSTGTPPLVEVAAGAIHAVALDERGDFWSWGAAEFFDEHGELLGTVKRPRFDAASF